MTVSEDYGREFFDMHIPWRCEYLFIADTLMKHLDFMSVVDLGCGCGYILKRMAELGRLAFGFDGSEHAFGPELEGVQLQVIDLTIPLTLLANVDLIICTEVAEHLAEQYADILVQSICDNTRRWVFFSAAEPGYGGHLHLNEQSRQYWVDKFFQFGFMVDDALTQAIKLDLEKWLVNTWWFPKNAFVLRSSK